jgi:hypothetical protein
VKEVSELANGTIEGNGTWKMEGVTRSYKTAQYMYFFLALQPSADYDLREVS